MTDPKQYLYSENHTWAYQDADGAWLVGITAHAQDMLGDIVFVDAPNISQVITQGMPCGLVESVKTGSDLYAPLSGTVLAINAVLSTQPELLNEQPYTSWIFKLEADASGSERLLDVAAYHSLTA